MTLFTWIGIFVTAIAIILAVSDVFWPFTVVLILSAIGGWWFGHLAQARELFRPSYIAIYIAIGFCWVFFKWTRVVEREWKKKAKSAPKWEDHSYAFAAYFFYWPIDAIAYVLSDLLRDAWDAISRMVSTSFNNYAEWRFKSHEQKWEQK